MERIQRMVFSSNYLQWSGCPSQHLLTQKWFQNLIGIYLFQSVKWILLLIVQNKPVTRDRRNKNLCSRQTHTFPISTIKLHKTIQWPENRAIDKSKLVVAIPITITQDLPGKKQTHLHFLNARAAIERRKRSNLLPPLVFRECNDLCVILIESNEEAASKQRSSTIFTITKEYNIINWR